MDSNWKICDPCARVGDNVKAMIWCEQCKELLCSACLKSFHSRLKDSRTHKFLSISESQKLPKISDYQVNEPCNEHKGMFNDYFCSDHSEMCCIVCVADNHCKCLNIKSMQEVVKKFVEDKIDEAVITDLNCLNKGMTILIRHKRKQIETISAEKDRIISESEFCIKQAIDKLEKIKSRIKADVSKTGLSKVKPIQEQIDTFCEFNENIFQNVRLITTMRDQGNAKQGFITLQKIKKTLKAQRKMFDLTAYDDTNYSMFELVLNSQL
ncbi:Hypothetical predicted protein [Mytilus galloprovincialis]|uniref:B box-type domain-containing protein n=1 Tax=Mytilus galloprovincialis TaxID=29158 RepID=A0A8B6BFV2_MYTGA|nr:Hypothetical predicted protein [Mytilus galloprovincialis]